MLDFCSPDSRRVWWDVYIIYKRRNNSGVEGAFFLCELCLLFHTQESCLGLESSLGGLRSARSMVFTEAEIEDIKTEVPLACCLAHTCPALTPARPDASQCFANDVAYNYEVLKNWSEDKIRDFFEAGGGGEGGAASSIKGNDGFDPFAIDMPGEVQWRMNADKTVAVITLNRPAAKNALDDKADYGLKLAIMRVKCSPSLRVVFLTGNGAMFCAGGDPKSFQAAAAAANTGAAPNGSNDNDESAVAFALMLEDLNNLPVYLVCGQRSDPCTRSAPCARSLSGLSTSALHLALPVSCPHPLTLGPTWRGRWPGTT